MRNETSISIAAAPERVWAVLMDVERWPEWTDSIASVERLDEGEFKAGSRVRIKQPRVMAAIWQVTSLTPGQRFEWENVSPGLHSTACHIVEAEGEGSRVTLWVDQTGLLSPLFGVFFGGMTRRYIRMEAEGLKRRCESDA